MNMLQLMEERHSVRQYTDRRIEDEKRDELNAECRRCCLESGLRLQIIYDDPDCFDSMLARYGKFVGVANYIAVVGDKKLPKMSQKAGYYGQRLVIKAQELGLNTCWVALTHGKSKAVVKRGEKLIAIIALGYGVTPGLPHKSKPIGQVVEKFNSADAPEWLRIGVRAAMLAPTALNQQKFKIAYSNGNVSITAPRGILTKVDLGIVKYNFEAATGRKTR